MKINARKKWYKNPLAVGAAVVIVAAGSYIAYAKTQNLWPFPSSTAPNATSELQPHGVTPDTSTGDSNADTTDDTATSPKTPIENEPSATKTDGIDVTITSVQQSSDTVRISSLVGTITSSGNCSLTLERDGMTVTKTSGIQALASSSTCKGFSVARSELSAGTWHLTLTIKSEGKTGTASKDFKVS